MLSPLNVRIGSARTLPKTQSHGRRKRPRVKIRRIARIEATAVAKREVKRVVLAYSGGLDTSVILKWLQNTYDCEVVTFTADLGQGEELEPARKNAEKMGASEIFIEDLKDEFVRDYVFPVFRANAVYEGTYLLGTSIARPLIAKRQVEIAREVGADAVAHGATGKGNDQVTIARLPYRIDAVAVIQVRFELGYYALQPDIKVIAPWREWDLTSRTKLIQFAEENRIRVPAHKRGEPPFSTDANLLHISYEGMDGTEGHMWTQAVSAVAGLSLEDPWVEPSEEMFTRSVSPEAAPDSATYVDIEFEMGDPVSIDGVRMNPAAILSKLNDLAGRNGIGRIDIVESRFVGMKSRGVYETPGGTILLHARRAIESITLDRGPPP